MMEQSIRVVPMIAVMGTIFFLSHQPSTTLPLPQIPGFDKLAHATVYACLAGSVIYAVPIRFRTVKPLLTAMTVVLFCLVYGISDEYHQSFIPGREPSFGDLLADTTGAVLLAVTWYYSFRRRNINSSSQQE